MSWQVHRDAAGLWVITAPSGQVAGSTATRGEAVETVKHLGRVKELGARGVRSARIPTMTATMRTQLELSRRERDRRARAGKVSARARHRDPDLDRWLTERKRRNAA